MAKIYKAGVPIADTTPITNDIEDTSPYHVPSAAVVNILTQRVTNLMEALTDIAQRVTALEEQMQNLSE